MGTWAGELARAMRDVTGNLPRRPAIFPDQMAPVVRTGADGVRELTMMRWGFPQKEPQPGEKKRLGYVTNVRHPTWSYWGPWLTPENRCLVPVTSFCEPDNHGERSMPTWFAQDETRPPFFFAGIWRPWTGHRGTKANPADGDHLLYSFLTTEPNALVAPVHPKAMPVLLLDEGASETWLTGTVEDALALQRPAPEDALRIVAKGTKQDG
jgi:putative SOS response-associated peptidase YedK